MGGITTNKNEWMNNSEEYVSDSFGILSKYDFGGYITDLGEFFKENDNKEIEFEMLLYTDEGELGDVDLTNKVLRSVNNRMVIVTTLN